MYKNGNMPFFSLALLKVIEGQGHVVWWRSVCPSEHCICPMHCYSCTQVVEPSRPLVWLYSHKQPPVTG